MSQTRKLINQQQDSQLWEGFLQYTRFPDWFVAVRDTHRLTEELLALPEFRSGGWRLKECRVGHIRYQNRRISALYRLTVRKPGEDTNAVIDLQGTVFPPGKLSGERGRVVGSLGTDTWHAVLPGLDLRLEPNEPDVPLAALEFLTDPEASRKFLEKHLSAAYPGILIKTCSPKVVRYNRGDRCTIVYRLDYETEADPKPEWPRMVVAKTYHGNAGKNAFEGMWALWNSPLGSSRAVKIAKPLAYEAENRVLIQSPLGEEKTLEALLGETVKYRSPDRLNEFHHYMRLTAQGLAALHQSGVRSGKVWEWQDQVEMVQKQVDDLSASLPGFRATAAAFLDQLNQLAMQTPADRLVPSHGTFRTPQVLLHQGEIAFIDFDSFRQSEPADDLALFLGEMFNYGLTPQDLEERRARKPLEPHVYEERFQFLMTTHDDFLEEYQRRAPVSYRRVVLWEALDMFLFILHDWTKIKTGDLESTVNLLQRFWLSTIL